MKDKEDIVDVSTLANFNLLPIWEKKGRANQTAEKRVFQKEKGSRKKHEGKRTVIWICQ